MAVRISAGAGCPHRGQRGHPASCSGLRLAKRLAWAAALGLGDETGAWPVLMRGPLKLRPKAAQMAKRGPAVQGTIATYVRGRSSPVHHRRHRRPKKTRCRTKQTWTLPVPPAVFRQRFFGRTPRPAFCSCPAGFCFVFCRPLRGAAKHKTKPGATVAMMRVTMVWFASWKTRKTSNSCHVWPNVTLASHLLRHAVTFGVTPLASYCCNFLFLKHITASRFLSRCHISFQGPRHVTYASL